MIFEEVGHRRFQIDILALWNTQRGKQAVISKHPTIYYIYFESSRRDRKFAEKSVIDVGFQEYWDRDNSRWVWTIELTSGTDSSIQKEREGERLEETGMRDQRTGDGVGGGGGEGHWTIAATYVENRVTNHKRVYDDASNHWPQRIIDGYGRCRVSIRRTIEMKGCTRTVKAGPCGHPPPERYSMIWIAIPLVLLYTTDRSASLSLKADFHQYTLSV